MIIYLIYQQLCFRKLLILACYMQGSKLLKHCHKTGFLNNLIVSQLIPEMKSEIDLFLFLFKLRIVDYLNLEGIHYAFLPAGAWRAVKRVDTAATYRTKWLLR